MSTSPNQSNSPTAKGACPPLVVGLAAILLLLGTTSAWAAKKEPPITVKAELDKAFITIGDPVEYTVSIRHDPTLEILSSIPPPAGDILKIKKIEDLQRKENGMTVEGKKFTLTAFRLGQFILDPVEIQFRNPKNELRTLKTNPLFLTIKSVGDGKPAKDIRGVKPVVTIPFNATGLIITLVVLALGIGGWILYRLLHKTPGPVKEPEPELSPEAEALQELDRLFESDWLSRGKMKEYYFRLSEILRHFLERRFQILAVESTTDEIRRALREKELEGALRNKIQEVLEAADLAKFAKWRPEPAETVRINQKSKQIVDEARPQGEGPRGV